MEDRRDILGRTALHLAANTTTLHRLEELLISRQLIVNDQDARGHTPLHCFLMNSISAELIDIKKGIQILLDHGSDVNIQDKFEDTPIHVVFYGHDKHAPEIVRFLLKVAQSPPFVIELQNKPGYTVFYKLLVGFRDRLKTRDDFEIIVNETETLIRDFLEGNIIKSYPIKKLLDMADVNGYSAFHVYVHNADHNVDICEKMIKIGANINTQSLLGMTPLMDALSNREDGIVASLLQAGADPNICDIFGQSALLHVKTKGCFDLLCEKNPDFHIKDKFGRLPINDMEIYVPEDLPRGGITPVNVSSNPPLAALFFDHGSNSNNRDFHGSSPLHYAAFHGNPHMVIILLEHGADVNIVDNYGSTPFKLAKEAGNDDLSELLKNQEHDSQHEMSIEKDKFKEFPALIINQTEIKDMDKVLINILNLGDDPQNLVTQLLNSPRVGIAFNQPEANELKTDIITAMKKLASFVGSLDPIFQCTVIPVGSSIDGSKIADPDEFDFMFHLDIFSEECYPYQSDEMLNSGFAGLKLKSFQVSHPLAQYVTDDLFLKSYVVRDTFQEMVTIALNKPEFWDFENLHFDGIIRFPTDKPILNLQFRRFGSIIKDINVAIDIVPAVSTKTWIPEELVDFNMPNKGNISASGNYHLLFQPPEGGKFWEIGLRISASLQELLYLTHLPSLYLESYAAAKLLISEYFCPNIQIDEKFNITSIFEESDIEYVEEFAIDSSEYPQEDFITNAVLVRNGLKYEDLTFWTFEIDETLTIQKLFTPTIQKTTGNLCGTNTQVEICELIHIKKGQSKWIYLGPIESVRKTVEDISHGDKNVIQNMDISEDLSEKSDTLQPNTVSREVLESDSDNTDSDVSSADNVHADTLEWEGGQIIYAWDEISSYMLKNCIFEIASEIKNEQDNDLIKIIIAVFEKLRVCAENRQMRSHFLPFLDIFTFTNKHIRLISDEHLEMNKEMHCKRISMFCDMILGILRQK